LPNVALKPGAIGLVGIDRTVVFNADPARRDGFTKPNSAIEPAICAIWSAECVRAVPT
jgi:hypothetical protein